MKKIYFDCNVIIDWATEREPFSANATALFNLVRANSIAGYVSPLVIANAFYAIRKAKGKDYATQFLKVCQNTFHYIDNPANALAQAIDKPYKDFEDDIHFYSAIDKNMDILVTRNKKDFPQNKSIQILTPDELLYELGY